MPTMITRAAVRLLPAAAALLLGAALMAEEEPKQKQAKVNDGTSNTVSVRGRRNRGAESPSGGAARRAQNAAGAGNGKERTRSHKREQ